MTNDATRASAEAVPIETRDVGDAIDIICRAIAINELMFEAAHRLGDKAIVNAYVEGSSVIHDFLVDAKAVLYAAKDAGETA